MHKPLYVTILWHMHQPYYKDPVKGEYALPWTYLHGIKDYYDMAAIVEEIPAARVNFNLVPSLLEQIEDYAGGTAVDPFLIRGSMPPADMGEDDRLFILDNFFSANLQRMIEPYPRYRELLHLAGDEKSRRDRMRQFRDQDILDLQVWFFLTWTGEAARRHHPALQELIRKGRNFSAADRELLFSTNRQILAEIVPLYRRLAASGRVELSISPYFHPILPLLCDLKSAHTAMPRATLPAVRFRHPEDARRHVELGKAYFHRLFGFTPKGMWPSEGSVSDEALAAIAACGIQWAATDEEVLGLSLHGGLGHGKEALYHPYRYASPEGEVSLLFRDHTLSDLIGFTYSQWEPERAIADFMTRLKEVRSRAADATVVPIILDGENAWEYYPDNAYGFLTGLYTAMGRSPELQPATIAEVLEQAPARRQLQHIHPGSWISANYDIWIGHPEENLAWELLAQAREAAVAADPQVAGLLERPESPAGEVPEPARLICKAIDAAEGSDWFWWYGDDHYSPHSDRFDALFRSHLANVYRLLKLDIPRQLFEPIKKKTIAGFVRDPAGLITPCINGTVSDYFEWLAAGLYDLSRQSSAMHAAENLLQSFFYGFDRAFLYFRVDGVLPLEKIIKEQDSLTLRLFLDKEFRIEMRPEIEEGQLLVRTENGWEDTPFRCQWKIIKICEMRVPLAALNLQPGTRISVTISLERNGEEAGRWPADSPMQLAYTGPDIELENWLI